MQVPLDIKETVPHTLLSVLLQKKKLRQSQANSLLFHQTNPQTPLSTKQKAGNTRSPNKSRATEIRGGVRFASKIAAQGFLRCANTA